MLIDVATGTVVLQDGEGMFRTLPYEPLSEKDMVIQAKYHLFIRRNDYRRDLVCRECRQPMTSDTQKNEDDDTWEFLSHCSCRAIYGSIDLRRLSAMTT